MRVVSSIGRRRRCLEVAKGRDLGALERASNLNPHPPVRCARSRSLAATCGGPGAGHKLQPTSPPLPLGGRFLFRRCGRGGLPKVALEPVSRRRAGERAVTKLSPDVPIVLFECRILWLDRAREHNSVFKGSNWRRELGEQANRIKRQHSTGEPQGECVKMDFRVRESQLHPGDRWPGWSRAGNGHHNSKSSLVAGRRRAGRRPRSVSSTPAARLIASLGPIGVIISSVAVVALAAAHQADPLRLVSMRHICELVSAVRCPSLRRPRPRPAHTLAFDGFYDSDAKRAKQV